MNQLTRQEVEAVVTSLQIKQCTVCGNKKGIIPVCDDCRNEYRFNTYIGDVLDYAIRKPGGLSKILKGEIMDTWFTFGLGRSLQEIINISGWDVEEKTISERIALWDKKTTRRKEVLTSPEANALFSFLIEIGL